MNPPKKKIKQTKKRVMTFKKNNNNNHHYKHSVPYKNTHTPLHTHTPLQNNIHVSKVHCGSAFGPGTPGLPYYCATRVCVPAVLGGLAM